MNVVKEIQKINELELQGNGQGSWHDDYKDSAHIFVGGLPFNLTEGDVIAIFSQYGEIGDINLPRDRDTQKPRGFAFLMYLDQRSTVLAVDNLNGAKVLGRTLRVDHTKNYRQTKVLNEETGKMEDADEERMNALPQMLGVDGQPAAAAAAAVEDAGEPGDEEDPMAAYIRENKRARLLEDQSGSASGSKPKKDKHRSKDEKRAEKEEKHRRKEEKRADKESKKHASSSSRRREDDGRPDAAAAAARDRRSTSRRDDDSPGRHPSRARRSPSPDPRDRRAPSARERERSPARARSPPPAVRRRSPSPVRRPRSPPAEHAARRRSPSPPSRRYPDDDRDRRGGDRREHERGGFGRDKRPPPPPPSYAARDDRDRRGPGYGGSRDERERGYGRRG